MTGLREYRRDARLLARAGEPELAPPAEEVVPALVERHLLRPGTDGARPVGARWTHARWKPGISSTAAFQVRFEDGSEELVVAKRYADGKQADLATRPERRAHEAARGRLRARAIVPDERLVLWGFPADRELPGHATLLDARRLARSVEEHGLVPSRAISRSRASWELLRYKPERRSVWRVELPRRDGEAPFVLVARVLPPRAAADVLAVRAPGGPLDRSGIGPALVASVPHAGLLLEEHLAVTTFDAGGLEHAARAGALAARIHALPSAPDSRRRCAAPRAALRALLAVDRALLDAAEAVSPVPPGRTAQVHGDLHPDQLAREEDGRWRLLDLDAAGAGDPARELAGWIADHLRERPEARFADAAGPLLEGYRAAGGDPPRTELLRAHVADRLVELAAGCLRRLELDALERARTLVARARALAGGVPA